MFASGLIILLLIVYFDARLLEKEDAGLFKEKFSLKTSFVFPLILLIVLSLMLTEDKTQALAVLIFIVFLPYYLFKRFQLLTALGQRGQSFHLACDAFSVILIWIFSGVIIATFVSAWFEFILAFESQLAELIFSAIGSSVLLLLLIYRASQRFSDRGFFYNVALVPGKNGFFKLVVLPVFLGFIFALVSVFIVSVRETAPQTPLSEIISETQSSQILVIFLLMAVGVAPLVEEIIFRGYLFHVLRQLKGLTFCVVLISLSFAVLHVGQYWGDWLAISMIALIGFALTIVRAWTQSTIASAVMHYVYNGAVTVIPIIMIMISNPAYARYQMEYPQLSFTQKEELLYQALKKDPDLADVHYELAALYLEENKEMDLALAAIEKASSQFPENELFLETKALILEKLRRYTEALDIRQKLLQKKKADNPHSFKTL